MLTFSRDSSNLIKYIYFKKSDCSMNKVKVTNIFFFINFFSQRQWTLLLIKCYNVPFPTHSILAIDVKFHFNYSRTPNIHEFLHFLPSFPSHFSDLILNALSYLPIKFFCPQLIMVASPTSHSCQQPLSFSSGVEANVWEIMLYSNWPSGEKKNKFVLLYSPNLIIVWETWNFWWNLAEQRTNCISMPFTYFT